MRIENIKGSCLCKRYQFTINGDFHCFMLCHCSRCQKTSGSAHGSNIFLKQATINWQDETKTPTIYQHPNCRFARAFCNICGSALPKIMDHDVTTVQCPAGSLDEMIGLTPTAHIFYKSSTDWNELLQTTPKYDELPQ